MISILYVDDETDLLDLGKLYLEEAGGIMVDTAPSARQALQLIKTNHYDAVVSDFQMPDMDGIAFLKYIRSNAGNLPVILFTGKGREDVVIEAINNGADYYLQKGGDSDIIFAELRARIMEAAERQRSKETIHHYNRLYAIMSGINSAILHIRTRDILFREICRIILEKGRFSRVWIGFLNSDRTAVFPAVCCGFEDEDLRAVPVAIDPGQNGQGLIGQAAYTKTMVARNGIGCTRRSLEGPTPPPDGYRSTAAFPIWSHNEVIGVFQIYAYEHTFFGEDEIRLLTEVSSDITFALENLEAEEERRKTELALAESEEKFRILVEESLVGVYIIEGRRFLHVNPKFAEIMGYTQQEIVEHLHINDLVSPESQNIVATNIQRRLSGETKSMHYAFKGMRKDGTVIDLEVAGTRTIFQGLPAIIGTIIDVTGRKRAEQERAQKLEELSVANRKIRVAEERLWAHIAALTESQERLNESEQRMTDIINFLPDATFAIDMDGHVLVWNRAIEMMTGIPAGEMLGKGDYEYAVPFYSERRPILANLVFGFDDRIAQHYDYLQKDGDKYTAQVFLAHLRDGRGAYASLVAAPLYDTQGNITGAIETIRDVSEFEEVRAALQASTDRYRHIMENTNDGVLIVRDGHIVYSNPVIRSMLGCHTPEDLRGKAVTDFLQVDRSAPARYRDLKSPNGTIERQTARLMAMTGDGRVRFLESREIDIEWEGTAATLFFLSEITDSPSSKEPVRSAQ